MAAATWQVWIDTGGTFTDCLAVDPAGALHRAKVLSSGGLRGRARRVFDEKRIAVAQSWNVSGDLLRGFAFRWLDLEHEPVTVAGFDAGASVLELDGPVPGPPGAAEPAFELDSGVEAPILAARVVTGAGAAALPPLEMRLATTRGTNALLERRGTPVVLLVTRGFADLLRIGDQQRPELFALRIEKPPPLFAEVVEVEGRHAADGSPLGPLGVEGAVEAARRHRAASAAVSLIHGYRDPGPEREIAEALRGAGFAHVSCAAELSSLIKLVPRTETAVVNAYLAPLLESYFSAIRTELRAGRLLIMTSAGGLVGADASHAKDCLLSGPAGGVAGAAAAARRSGFERAIGFDMGGTSTDVARYDGDFEYRFEHAVGGARLQAPALAIETVAAGGGSICRHEHGTLRVGPDSASALPGPARYGAGGPLTLTDVNLLLGRLDPQRFGIPIDPGRARAALEALLDDVERESGRRPRPEALLEGLLEIADQRMGDAIAEVSLRRGYDPADYVLVAFGGAGGQHACAVADHLGMDTVLMPADASLLSALGLGRAAVERFAERQVLAPLARADLHGALAALSREAVEAVAAEGAGPAEVRRRIVNLRLEGQETPIAVEMGDDLEARFARRYAAMYGHGPEQGRAVEIESVRVVASSRVEADDAPAPAPRAGAARPSGRLRAYSGGAWGDVPAYERPALEPGARIDGPGIVFDAHSAYVIEPGWGAEVDAAAALVLRRERPAETASKPAAVVEELFTNRFASIARQMGRMLERTALSTNVKERLDFSCALLDAGGELVAHAPHMPVHLGSLGLCVRAVRDAVEMAPGDVVVTNHPACGGSHLPDITVVTPIHAGGALVGYAASRAHHAEIGGTRPGSMPPLARSLAEEGVVIPPMKLVSGGAGRWKALQRLLREAPYPSRAARDNVADLRAQVAANAHGAGALAALCEAHGAGYVADRMAALKARAERLARTALSRLGKGTYEAEQRLDDGTPLRVRIEIGGERAVVDFTGSSGVHPGNLNATPAIVRSAVIYVLRVLIGEALPLNEGIMRAVDVRLARGLLDPEFPDDPAHAPAVGGGNVETSQRLVDTLLQALRVCACSQGTMNNTLFGTDAFSYYETVCGGSGAGPDFDGADAVHTHMTNTRITDPEILEHRYPVRLHRFAVRRGSGGAGRHRGGDGAVREIEFLEPMSLSVLSQHRTHGPDGLHGGAPGAPGAQRIVRASGGTEPLDAIDGAEMNPGDRLIMETPGGGGWGEGEVTGARPGGRS